MKYTALQRSDLIRAEYQAEIAIYDPSMLVFVDESGTDQRNATRHFGYALRGYSPRSFKFFSRGKRLSAIAALTVSKMLCYELHEQNVDGDTFYLFVQRTLLPTLLPFNGYNPNSVVVMDNCSIHLVPEVIELIHSVGAIVVFLPRTVLILHLSRRCLAKSRTLLGSMRMYSRQPPKKYLVLHLIP